MANTSPSLLAMCQYKYGMPMVVDIPLSIKVTTIMSIQWHGLLRANASLLFPLIRPYKRVILMAVDTLSFTRGTQLPFIQQHSALMVSPLLLLIKRFRYGILVMINPFLLACLPRCASHRLFILTLVSFLVFLTMLCFPHHFSIPWQK
jgi:hypothetical protein